MAYTYLLAGVLLQGPLADRPAASAGRYWYIATDEDGGTLYHSDGVATWTQAAPGVSSGGGGGTVTSVASSDSSITVTNPTTTPDLVIAVVDGGSA